MVCAALVHKVRQELEAKSVYFPDWKNKPCHPYSPLATLLFSRNQEQKQKKGRKSEQRKGKKEKKEKGLDKSQPENIGNIIFPCLTRNLRV